MTPVFGIDITNDKKNDRLEAEAFITKRNGDEDTQALDSEIDELNEVIESSRLPGWLRIAQSTLGIFSLIVLIAVLGATLEVGLETAFKNAPASVISAIAAGAAWAVITYIGRKKQTAVLLAAGADEQAKRLEESAEMLYGKLGVPENATEVDVLTFRFKRGEDGNIKVRTVGFQTAPYSFCCTKLYSDGDFLHIADTTERYSFSLSELKGIRTVKKRISAVNWTKECAPTKGELKPYKMTVNNFGDVFMKYYHVLELERGGEVYGIYFPCFELAAFEAATGLKADEYPVTEDGAESEKQ